MKALSKEWVVMLPTSTRGPPITQVLQNLGHPRSAQQADYSVPLLGRATLGGPGKFSMAVNFLLSHGMHRGVALPSLTIAEGKAAQVGISKGLVNI